MPANGRRDLIRRLKFKCKKMQRKQTRLLEDVYLVMRTLLYFASVALSSLKMVVAVTETCRSIAYPCKYMHILDQLVDSNLIDIRSTDNIVKFGIV